MGEVWRAFDPKFEKCVALKVLPPTFADDQDFQERFRRETRRAAKVDEPHVVPVLDFGEIEGRLYVAMQLIEGPDLQYLLDDGPLSQSRAVKIIEQISSALDAAHEAGLVHRNVKPSNILIAKNDFAYLIDFGIARAAGETKLTKTGAIVGSLAYMAPERFTAEVEDARADIYSLACVLHECLTGAPPYPGDSAEQQITAHLTLDPPRPSLRNPTIPGAFDEVIARGMAKQPAKRFSSASELSRAARAAAASPHLPNNYGPHRPHGTRRFSVPWPNPAGTGESPYPEQRRKPAPAERKARRGPLLLLAAAGLMLLAAVLIAALLVLRENGGSQSGPKVTAAPTGSTSETTTASLTTRLSATARQPQSSPSGTDALGFVGYPAARCDPGGTPAVMARTAQSLVVICEIGPANYYYRGLRLSDGASIELTNAVRSSGGFDVTNPVDGTRYQVRPTGISITSPSGQVSSEPMIEYAAK
jgi:serine/threonine protein kinase